ncbi:glycopeptide [Cyathus striatus]|nr:glycopeptide [Cyathus striatus]
MVNIVATFFAIATAIVVARAETHTVHFDNLCGFGTPTLVQNGHILSTGGDYTTNGPIVAAIAYLQTGGCGINGEGCAIVEMTLQNPTTPGNGSSVEISLIPSDAFNAPIEFRYYGGCDGTGSNCTSANCVIASPSHTFVPVTCQQNNVNLAITFCA